MRIQLTRRQSPETHIYSFCAPNDYGPKDTRQQRDNHHKQRLELQFLGLVHTLKQLREEFRSIYQVQTTYHIPLNKLKQYLRVWQKHVSNST